MYRDDSDDEMAPWLSVLYSGYISSGRTDTNDVFYCKSDQNGAAKHNAASWSPRKDNKYTEAYDRVNSTPLGSNGYDIVRNPQVECISYFYEFSHAPCSFTVGDTTDSWSSFKKEQMKTGNGGQPYDPVVFPVARCLWHIQKAGGWGDTIGDTAKPILNIAYAGNRCYTMARWEDGTIE